MLLVWHHQLKMHLGHFESTQEARVALSPLPQATFAPLLCSSNFLHAYNMMMHAKV